MPPSLRSVVTVVAAVAIGYGTAVAVDKWRVPASDRLTSLADPWWRQPLRLRVETACRSARSRAVEALWRLTPGSRIYNADEAIGQARELGQWMELCGTEGAAMQVVRLDRSFEWDVENTRRWLTVFAGDYVRPAPP